MKIKPFKLSSPWNIFWILIILSVVSLLLSFPHSKSVAEKTTAKIITSVIPSEKEAPSPTQKPTVSIKPPTSSKGTVIIGSPNPQQTNTSSSNSSTGGVSQNSELQVSVSITNSGGFSLSVPSGSNQCDVLSKALSDGKISSLNMRYNSDLGSNAVYQINGIGKDNSVWWTYTVNGQSPQGCSLVKVNNGDHISWNYIGS